MPVIGVRPRTRMIPRAPRRLGRKLVKLVAIFLLFILIFFILREASRFTSKDQTQSGKDTSQTQSEREKTEPFTSQKRTRQRAYASTTWLAHSEYLDSHQHLPSGLLEVNPSSTSTRPHPIHQLLKRSQTLWQTKLSKGSKNLREAVTEYKRRYSRPPPIGFEKWWAYVQNHQVRLPDEYDQIWRDIEVFWGFDVDVLERSHRRFLNRHLRDGVYIIKKDSWDSSIQHTQSLRNTIAGDFIIALLQYSDVAKHIPPFKIMVNPDDRPVVRKDWGLWERAVKAARHGQVLTSRPEAEHAPRPGFLSSCSPSSLPQYPTSLFPPRRQRHIKPSLRLPHPETREPHTLIHDHSSATNPCLNPHLFRAHGQFLSFDGGRGAHLRSGGLGEDIDSGGEEGWVGVISFSPTELHADITAAIPLEWIDDSEESDESYTNNDGQVLMNPSEPERNHPRELTTQSQQSEIPQGRWARKTDQRLHWRGTNTGMFAGDGLEWDLGQRVRGVDFLAGANNPEGSIPPPFAFPDELEVLDPRHGLENNGVLTVNRTLYTSKFMDVSFASHPTSCSDDVCEKLLKRYTWAVPVERTGVGEKRKFMLDMDGNAWSSRFKRLISSGSVVFKATVYNEWWTDRIQPWVHYVPVQVDFSDLWDIFVFFRGVIGLGDSSGDEEGASGAHDELAKEIGDHGYEWSRAFWRREDMVAYNFRLLLEYARATSRNRDRMSYVYNPKDEV
ncbi:hypothetical protein E1B28_003942 [Marasmius oreades]|uniref:Glycosyl transferase CAP10 domain-containing protein n=1 Tax=Marasmius oreades TaxID=181124 RepID=A0A9P7UXR4_9AGAR|nr:uncharacterized protein E1B28_003942 [Marasmius oreades]KAG7096513.1 hypothetical protein E1B28_003942 [Marasmius oreades]